MQKGGVAATRSRGNDPERGCLQERTVCVQRIIEPSEVPKEGVCNRREVCVVQCVSVREVCVCVVNVNVRCSRGGLKRYIICR